MVRKHTKPVRVLVIEDNPADVFFMREALKTCPLQVELTNAESGIDGLKLVAETTFDLAIVDLNLPDIDGHTLLKRFQATGIPMVVFSSSTRIFDEALALDLGADAFVHKPRDFNDFCRAVCGLITRWAAKSASN